MQGLPPLQREGAAGDSGSQWRNTSGGQFHNGEAGIPCSFQDGRGVRLLLPNGDGGHRHEFPRASTALEVGRSSKVKSKGIFTESTKIPLNKN